MDNFINVDITYFTNSADNLLPALKKIGFCNKKDNEIRYICFWGAKTLLLVGFSTFFVNMAIFLKILSLTLIIKLLK